MCMLRRWTQPCPFPRIWGNPGLFSYSNMNVNLQFIQGKVGFLYVQKGTGWHSPKCRERDRICTLCECTCLLLSHSANLSTILCTLNFFGGEAYMQLNMHRIMLESCWIGLDFMFKSSSRTVLWSPEQTILVVKLQLLVVVSNMIRHAGCKV